jgi:hypothetical protein
MAAISLVAVVRADSFTNGLYSQWVGDDYTPGNDWIDRIQGVDAALDGYPTPPISVSGIFGSHNGVQRDSSGGANDGGFSIPGGNAPTGYTNYTVSAVIYSPAAGPGNTAYFGADLIVGYDIGGAGQTDWGISYGGNGGTGIDAGIGLANGNDQGLNSPALSLYGVHALALQVGNDTISLYVDGALSAQATSLPIHAPSPQQGVIPLLSSVGSNIGQVFAGILAELRIYTNSTVDGAALTTYLVNNYSPQQIITLSTNAAGGIVGSNTAVTLSVPQSATASSPLSITLTSGNTVVTASQTVTLPVGVTTTNVAFPIVGVGVSTVVATAPPLSQAVVLITGVLPSITFSPIVSSTTAGNNVTATLTLTSAYPFSGPYTVTLTSDNPAVATSQTVTLPPGVASTNLTVRVLAVGFADFTATANGLNSGLFTVGTLPQVLNAGLASQWVGDDYIYGNDWIDRIQGVDAALDGYPTPPISVPGVFGKHNGVQQDPNGIGSDGGFSIPGANAPSGYTTYTVSAVIYSPAAGLPGGNYYAADLIVGYDIGGAGQTDWGISYGGNGGTGIDAGIGLANGNDQGLNSSALNLFAVHALALQVGNGTMSLYVDGALSAQATNLPIHAPNPQNAVIPLLSNVGANIGNVFQGALAELRIYTNSAVDGAALTAYLVTNYNYNAQDTIAWNTNAAGAIVGSNVVVNLSVPRSVTVSSPAVLTLASANPAVTASQTLALPVGVTATNVTFPIVGVGSSTVTATTPSLAVQGVVQISGALPSITFSSQWLSATVGSNDIVPLTLTCAYPFSGPYTVTLTSDNPAVITDQTVTLPAGVASTNLTFRLIATGFANLTATADGLNPAVLSIGTMPQLLNDGLVNQWVGDDYTVGNDWIDRIQGVDAALDGNATPPVSVSGIFGAHKGVQRDPAGGLSDAGFNIPGATAPSGNSNYTVLVVVYPTAAGPLNNNYYAADLIVGYDIGGAGKTDWGISWGGNGGVGFDAGIGLANGNDQPLNSPALSLNAVHTLALQVGNSTDSIYVDGDLVAQATNVPIQAPNPQQGAIPLLSTLEANIGQVFPGALAELRIYTNSAVDGRVLTAYVQTNDGGILLPPPIPTTPIILPVYRDSTGTNLVFTVTTQTGFNYYLLSATNLNPPIVWLTNSTTAGTGGTITNIAPISEENQKQFFRFLVQ